MKENAIRKINHVGKIGRIFSIIAMILVCIGLVGALIGTAAVLMIPDDLLRLDLTSGLRVTVDPSVVGLSADEMDLHDLEYFRFTLAGNDYTFHEASVEGSGITASDGKIILDADANIQEFSLRTLFVPMLAALLIIILALVTLVFVLRLCKAFEKCASPFEKTVIDRLIALACALVPWALFSGIADSTFQSLFSNQIHLSFRLDLGMVLVVLIIFALAFIFKYGAILQQESDETL